MGSKEEETVPPNGVLSFTLFVILPSEDVCSLRNLASGVTIRDLRCRLELMAGIPSQIYRLVCSDGQGLHEDHQLLLDHNVWDGYIIRVQIHDSWRRLYDAVLADDVDYVINHGAVHFQNQKIATPDEEIKFKDIVRERGFVALFLASYNGSAKMCLMLLSIGVNVNGKTPFSRTPLFAAVCQDHDRVMDVLLQHGGSLEAKDCNGDTPELVARKCFSKQCVRKLRIMKLHTSPANGYILNGNSVSASNRKFKVSFIPSPPIPQISSRPATVSKSRLVKRHTVATVSANTIPHSVQGDKGEAKSSHQYFMWETDNVDSRCASAARFRIGTPGTNYREMPRLGTANSRHSVKWDDSTPRTPSRHTPVRRGSLQQPSILKNRGDNSATLQSRKSVSRESCPVHVPTPPRVPSEHGSQLSVASAPGIGQDNSGTTNGDARSVESAPELQDQTSGDESATERPATSSKESTKRPRSRLLVSRHRTTESWRTMKRRIQMAENKKKATREDKQKKRETFDDWLNRKRKQEKRDSRESDSEDSTQESDNEGGNSQAFEDWLKDQRERPIRRPQTITVADLYRRKTRPLKGLVTVNDPPEVNLDYNENMTAHKKWREKYNNVGEYEDRKGDVADDKKKVEDKRQRLLAMAISYDEWMEYNEDRKQLMKRILQANMAELQKIEEERMKKRTSRQISYSQWRDKVEKQETVEKIRKERMRVKQAEENSRLGEYRSSACVPHDVWMRKKAAQQKAAQAEKENAKQAQKAKPTADGSGGFEQWMERKHQKEMTEIQTQIKKERDMIKVLRDRRLATVSFC